MPYRGSATILPQDDFDAQACAETLKEAMDGCGTNEEAIINTLASISNSQRQEVADHYKQAAMGDLIEDLKSELRGDLENVIIAMMMNRFDYDAKCLREAMKGPGTDESVLVEIMCSRINEEIEEIKGAYNRLYDRDLESDLISETSGCFENLMRSQCNAGREDSYDDNNAYEDASTMFQAGEGQLGTDESGFMSIICQRSYPHLRKVFRQYEAIADGNDIENAVDSEFSGHLRDGLLAIIRYAKFPPSFFANRLHEAISGGGTDEDSLTRVIVSRSEIDLANIKYMYAKHFEQSLKDAIEGDVGGDFKKVLLALIGEPEIEPESED